MADALPCQPVETHPSLTQMIDLQKRLWAAKAPVALLGGSRWDEQAVSRYADFAERFQLPTAVTFRRQMLMSPEHPCFIGDLGIGPNPKLLERVKGPISCCSSAGGSRRCRASPTRCSASQSPAASSCMCTLIQATGTRLPSGAGHQRIAPTAFCAALQTVHPPQSFPGRGAADEGHAAMRVWSDRPPRFPARSTPARRSSGSGTGCRTTR